MAATRLPLDAAMTSPDPVISSFVSIHNGTGGAG
jgi:hypothetical protein